MFSRLNPSILSLSATTSILAVYSNYIPVSVSFIFLGLSLICMLLALASCFKKDISFFSNLNNSNKAVAIISFPFALLFAIYRISKFSILISPYQNYFLLATVFFLSLILIFLVICLAGFENQTTLFNCLTMFSYTGILIYFAEFYNYNTMSSIFLVLYILGSILLFIPCVSLIFSAKTSLSSKSSILMIFLNLVIIFHVALPNLKNTPAFLILGLLVFLSCLLIFVLWWSDKMPDENLYNSRISTQLAYGLFVFVFFKENYILSQNVENINELTSLNRFINEALPIMEYILLFLAFFLFLRYFLDYTLKVVPRKK